MSSRPKTRRRLAVASALGLALGALPGSPARAAEKIGKARGSEPSEKTVAQMLQADTQELMDAVGSGDTAVWNRLLGARVTYVDENGSLLDRKALVDGIKPLPAGVSGTIRVTEFHAAIQGDVAVTTHVDDEHEVFHGHELHCQYRTTDTWQRAPGGWRLVGGQVLALRTDPPALDVGPDDLEEYTGRYMLAPDVAYEIRQTDHGLEGRQTGRNPEPLKVEAGDVLFVPGKPRYRKVFLRGDDGDITGFAERREAWELVYTKQP
ncbi:MAG: nuclear transport factor 2 family protein [Thermoanaerobaculia bacterium]